MFNLSEFISFVYESQLQARLFHYQTSSYAQHVAFGNFYDSLYDCTDGIIEILVGRYGRPIMDPEDQTVSVDNMIDVDLDMWVETMSDYFQGVKDDLDLVNDSDVINKLDEVLAAIGSLKFFLSLN